MHAIDRRLERPGELACHHFGGAAIVAEDRIGGLLAGHVDDVAEFDDAAVAGERVRRDRQRQRALVDDLAGSCRGPSTIGIG